MQTSCLTLHGLIRLRPRTVLASCLLALLFLGGGPVKAQSDASPALASLQQRVLAGKLSWRTLERLRERLGTGPTVRVIVGLSDPGERDARLSGARARTPVAREARRKAIARLQRRLLRRSALRGLRSAHRFKHVSYLSMNVDASQIERIAAQPEVSSITVDERLRPTLHDTVPMLGADLAWLQGYSGSGQSVAVLDTGVDGEHPAFSGRIVSEACYSTTSVVENSVSLCPGGVDSLVGPGAAINCDEILGCDHGTHVSGIVLGDDATYRGIAPDATLIHIQVFSQLDDLFGCGFFPPCLTATTSDVIRGLERVYELRDTHDIAAVNMSLGGEGYPTAAACEAEYPALTAAIENLRSVGITTIVASGNSYLTAAISTPACISSAVSVGAVGVLDSVGDFSNSADYLDLLAPGVGIVAPVPGGGFEDKTGTSMASPHVAGAVAVLRSASPGATPDELVDAMKITGVPVTDWRNDIITPRVQVDAAADHLTEGQLDKLAVGLRPYASGFVDPVVLAHAGDGSDRLFVGERGGRVLVHDDGAVLATPFLDVSARVACCAGDGLLGLAFHPAHESNGLVFVSYLDDSGAIVVERHAATADPNQVDGGPVQEILRVPGSHEDHHGGGLRFGTDGYLYIAVGDGPEDVDGQSPAGDPASLLGKLLRIDVDGAFPYVIPPDNPYAGDVDAEPEIWAVGLRDPDHLGIDPLSGQIYIADPGESLAHEVNVQAAASTGGEDYGWNIMEGSECRDATTCGATSGYTPPIAEYGFDEGCAVTGGAVYRAPEHLDLQGAYLYGDRCSGRLWGLRDRDEQWQQVQFGDTPLSMAAFGNSDAGDVFVADAVSGEVYRLVQSELAVDTLRLPTAFIGLPYSEPLSAINGATPYQWAVVDGALPAGVSLDGDTGLLAGTPLAAETAVFTVQLSDAEFAEVTRIFRMTVIPPPLVLEINALPYTTLDQSYLQMVTASGGSPPYSFGMSAGVLPAGIALAVDGTLSGSATEQGEFSFTVQVTDSAGVTASGAATLRVYGPTLALVLNEEVNGSFGSGFGSDNHAVGLLATFTGTTDELVLRATGYDIDYEDELAVYLNGDLLGYLSVGANDGLNATDHLIIASDAQLVGENQLLFRLKTSGWTWGITDVLLTDGPAPLVIQTASLPQAMIGQAYSALLEAGGGRLPLAWDLSAGSLPAGLTLAADGSLGGTPSEQGVFDITVRVTDALGNVTEQAFSLWSLGPSGTIEIELVKDVTDMTQYGHRWGTDQHYTELVANFAGGAVDLTLDVTGYDIDFVDELAVYLNGNLLGYLSVGSDTSFNAGDLFVIPAGSQQPSNQLRFVVSTPGYMWGVTGLLLSDLPPPLLVTSTTVPDAVLFESYANVLQASGGRAPYTWELGAGALPAGLSLAADGTLSGTPSQHGQYDFVARVIDGDDRSAEQALSLTVTGGSSAGEVDLQLGVTDTTQYGHRWGTDQHYVELVANFPDAGVDLTLDVTGYDIDFTDEVAVYLNNDLLGYLSEGSDVSLNGGDQFVIPAGSQLASNQVRFVVSTPGYMWGVTGLLLSDVPPPLQVTSTTVPDGTVDESYASVVLQAAGGRAPYTWELGGGVLPGGMSLAPDGTLSGTPAQHGVFDFVARAIDVDARIAEQPLTLSVAGPGGAGEVDLQLGVTDATQYGHRWGTDQHYVELVANFPDAGVDLTLDVTGYDIDFTDEVAVYLNGNLLGYLSVGSNMALNGGDQFLIPAVSQLASNQVRFVVSTPGYMWGVTALLLSDVPPPLLVTSATVPDGALDESYASVVLQAAGGRAPYTWELGGGVLPAGMNLAPDGTLSGTPSQHGEFDFVARVIDADARFAEQSLTLNVTGPSGAGEVDLQLNVADMTQYGHRWGTDQHYIELVANFPDAGVDLTLNVVGYDVDFIDEVAVYLNGAQMGYLSVGPNKGLNSGDQFLIPAASQLSSNQVRFVVSTPGYMWGVTELLLTDTSPLEVTSATLPDAVVGESYTSALQATGGRAPYVWALASGVLPAGVTLAVDGTLSGTPSQHGDFDFVARVVDDDGQIVEQALSLSAIIEVDLAVGVTDSTQYGHRWGTQQHYTELHANFTGGAIDLTLSVTGYDIDFTDEVAVYLNGDLLGYLSVGPNKGLNAGDTFLIPTGSQQQSNQLRFVVSTPGYMWGVTELLLSE